MKSVFAAVLFLFLVIPAFPQHDASAKEYMKTFTTYPYSDPNPIALLSPVYPYFRYDGFTDKPIQKEWKVVELQNDYIRLMILPGIGGKIWAAIENKTGRSFIYYNGAVKFRDVAMRGPWTSGGLEANYGIIGHTPTCAAAVDYIVRTNSDGSASCIIGALDLLTRSQWRMEINLSKDKAFFTTKSFWYNSTPLLQPYYHWMNLGVKAKGNLEFIFPGTHYIGHEGEHAGWPVNKDNGKHINFYEQNDFGGYKSYHVAGKLTHFFGAYYHDDEAGMVRYGTYDDKAGKKIWIWGLSRQGMIWEKMLTDTNGQYVEIQSGRLFNQNTVKSGFTPFKHIGFAPYATDTWTEYWYPVSGIKGMVEANAYGALNIKQETGWLKIYLSAVQKIDDTLEVKSGGKTIYSKRIQLSPLQVFADSVKANPENNNFSAVLGDNKIVYDANPEAGVLNRPIDAPKDFNWNSAYGEYIQGRELIDMKMYTEAGQHLQKSLEKDGNYLPALVKMALLQYRSMQYEIALNTIRKALQIDALDGEANYYYGVINDQLKNTADAKDGFSIAALAQEYKTAAYTALAKIAGKEKDHAQLIRYAEKALDFNRYNLDALMLEAVTYRNLGDTSKAGAALQTILSYDPLNHFARFEKYLNQKTDYNRIQFVSSVKNELPHETFTELAIWYYNMGYVQEAKEVFGLSPASAEKAYWQSFLQGQKVDCSKIDPAFAFPFRSETAAVLEHLLKSQDDWLLKYQLALIYHDRGRIDECKALLNGCGFVPGFAPFYAVRAAVFKKDSTQCLRDLQKALSLDKEQWRYNKLLAEYYIGHNQPANALAVTEPFYKTHPEQYIMGMLYAKTLLLNKKYKDADAMLSKLNIIPFEGATEGRALYREAKLMQAVEALQQGNHKKAAQYIKQARLWPETLGVGKPYDDQIDNRLEDWMEYLAGNGKSEIALDRILKFTPRIDNTVSNFIPSNALVTAWALEKKEGWAKAISWLDEQIAAHPAKALQWSKAMFEGNGPIQLAEEEKDASIRILEAVAGLHFPRSTPGQ